MSAPLIDLDVPESGPDAEAVLRSLQTPHPEGSDALGGIVPAPEPGTGAEETDAEKLARAKPGRKRSPISKHRTKPELLQAAREQETRIRELEAQLGVGGSETMPTMAPADIKRSCETALDATIEVGSRIAAAYRGDHWVIEGSEREILRDAWVPILMEYAPQLGKALPWLGAVSTTALVLLPRLGKDAELAKARRPAQPTEPVTATTQGQTPDQPLTEPERPQIIPGRHVGGPV